MRPRRSTAMLHTTSAGAGIRQHAEVGHMPVARAAIVALYWHIGETTIRLANSIPASRIGVNSALVIDAETRLTWR